jgi:hypothetical protein
MLIIGCDFHTRYQQIAQAGGAPSHSLGFLPGGLPFGIQKGGQLFPAVARIIPDYWQTIFP